MSMGVLAMDRCNLVTHRPIKNFAAYVLNPISHGVKEDLPSHEGWGYITTGLTKYFPTDFLLFLAKGITYSFNTLYLRAF